MEIKMVFHCRCFSFEGYEFKNRGARSTSTEKTFYTASSDFHPAVVPEESEAKPSVFSDLLAPNTSSNVRVFTLAELKAATKGFCRDSEIGKRGVGRIVYKGLIKGLEDPFDEIQVAIKYANGELQGHKKWVTEVNVLGAVEHPNLVKLIGYCYHQFKPKRLLVYEYMPNKSVEYHLSTTSEPPLTWTTRLKLAQDVARGLAYLHEEMGFQIIFEGFKSSSILLDDQWNAKLSFFGLAKLRRVGEREPTSRNEGYKAPECFRKRRHTSKSNVWSYGVFLYELITGRRPLDKKRPKNKQKLLEWVKPYLDSKKFQKIIDPRLKGNYSLESVNKLSIIADRCLSKDPKSRPKMSKVLEMVNQLIAEVQETVSQLQAQAANAAPPPPPEGPNLVRVVSVKLKKVLMCSTKYETTHEG